VLSALNGVLGDHLKVSANPLAIPMQFRCNGVAFEVSRASITAALPHATGKILLLVHGLCMSDLQWRRNGHDHGAALAQGSGFSPVYLRYNSGLHVSENGRELAAQLDALVREWPVPVEEIIILGHSMGGLVTRSACHYAELAGYGWRTKLAKIFFLGTPHHGAPLERGGHWLDVVLDASPYTTAFARLGKMRSAGITDLRHGSMLDADWKEHDRFARAHHDPLALPLPVGVACYALAAVIAKKASPLAERLLGDGLVPLASALGQHEDAALRPGFPTSHQWIGYGMHHLDLLDRREVLARLRAWL
jgi:pimeloyl-ACP methyl ester carboxylesterase